MNSVTKKGQLPFASNRLHNEHVETYFFYVRASNSVLASLISRAGWEENSTRIRTLTIQGNTIFLKEHCFWDTCAEILLGILEFHDHWQRREWKREWLLPLYRTEIEVLQQFYDGMAGEHICEKMTLEQERCHLLWVNLKHDTLNCYEQRPQCYNITLEVRLRVSQSALFWSPFWNTPWWGQKLWALFL